MRTLAMARNTEDLKDAGVFVDAGTPCCTPPRGKSDDRDFAFTTERLPVPGSTHVAVRCPPDTRCTSGALPRW